MSINICKCLLISVNICRVKKEPAGLAFAFATAVVDVSVFGRKALSVRNETAPLSGCAAVDFPLAGL